MKKFLFAVSAIMCVALLSVCFSSCTDKEDEPLAALYTVGGSPTNDVKKMAGDPETVQAATANYEALRAELITILKTETWSASLNNKTKDEVLKREDATAKQKFDEMVTKVNAFKTKVENLDKTQAKNQFNWDVTVEMACSRAGLNIDKVIDTKTVTIHYVGLSN